MDIIKCNISECMDKFPNSEYWNDSCLSEDLDYALQRGAVGATTNPMIIPSTLEKEMPKWRGYIKNYVENETCASEEDIAWMITHEICVQNSKRFLPIFEDSKGRRGRFTIQTNIKNFRDSEKLLEQTLYLNSLAPNLHIKLPGTKSAMHAIEEATYAGISVIITLVFTVSQTIAAAEAVERGLKRREAEGKSIDTVVPACAIMTGRLDDWLKAYVKKEGISIDPACLDWAGIAVFKKSYGLYKQRDYRTKLLVAAYRNILQWTELIGGDCIMTLPPAWQQKINDLDGNIEATIDRPVSAEILKELYTKLPEFMKAYNEEWISSVPFETFGAMSMTLRDFIAGYDKTLHIIRDAMLPDPFCK